MMFRQKKTPVVTELKIDRIEQKKSFPVVTYVFLLCICVVLISISSVYAFTKLQNNSNNASSEISDRTQEFIQNQKNDSDAELRTLRTGEMQSQVSTEFAKVESNCFNFVIPFKHKYLKITEEYAKCIVRASQISPLGVMVVTAQENKGLPLAEDSGVKLRQAQTNIYKEESIQFSEYSEQLQFSSKDSLVTFLRKNNMQIVVAFSEVSGGIQPKHFEYTKHIVDSLQLKTLPTPSPQPSASPKPTSTITPTNTAQPNQ